MPLKRDSRLLGLRATLAICLLEPSITGLGQSKKLTTGEARDHIGEQATVCGKVASTRYAATTCRKPTFLNLDKPYPSQVFVVLIRGENRAKFGATEEQYRGKQICVTGTITEYRKAPEIVVSDAQSIEVQR
jgi:hypothetical protein